ncbi:hypothetical protein B6A09_0055 [Saccharomyces cerevisiae synthetic construct]|uniref:Putative uncharacterized protein YBL096C n=2 Tax=Saccharomyces cerevisiae TaxID=4932 RepID=YBJ6_YEAST|nr:RecName: Full=Putative uncharacterized protein YBL096C [Saccharomyces cerevisiae S288C]AAS56653.1 YBL096C [Saccharomyces cerevisiae]ARB01686.1 hypothetical protein B6A09_0055 [Saccharomyces cerevisiae synthetic construct]EWG87507.1 hypothetical protein R008_B10081 [Saccharomyces cerevisiae R008]EWG92305.1 hypothetical protein P301_B10081 [Saccharomyces cerevisiae P301]EWG97633.1 hypothetical protein R103_B10081 [Saccharomyces cerevisiae R103]EWH19345.1 hypothetical protein P283_B10081 [Sac
MSTLCSSIGWRLLVALINSAGVCGSFNDRTPASSGHAFTNAPTPNVKPAVGKITALLTNLNRNGIVLDILELTLDLSCHLVIVYKNKYLVLYPLFEAVPFRR